VSDVKDQGGCGSCWAFSADETIESAWAVAGNPLTLFSPQQIVSCDTDDAGCNGGLTETAFDYVVSAGGLATEEDYPYTSGTFPWRSGTCKDVAISGGTITGYTYAVGLCRQRTCNNQDEASMAAVLTEQHPLSVCVDASSWSYYTGGIATASSLGCSNGYTSLDHCVQAVGFKNIDSSNGYWIVRNQWGTDWGENGYIYLAYGANTCGVATESIYVNLA